MDFVQKFPENELLYVIVEAKADAGGRGAPPTLGQWTSVADDISARLRRLPKYVADVQGRVPPATLACRMGCCLKTRLKLPQRLAEVFGSSRSF